ncbi:MULTISPECIES: hypothetical protein [Streptomyces]|uniref:Uncharacterized protein n=1 Tax=Streptomyces cacaoi TaxID=1898 RepID=A0A4Y3QZ25_STRCI|nr:MULTISPECIES: hypothetical protein [Streptomyces]NNG83987.1 hypothetical protein [Streptomyces cacaoi]QHF96960.1 hypothetical protein DEH18_27425 [Streptomyces sp. NHF165]GEB50521.1 hypothetical protein SCA03_30720 [Streptomyces cacaoi]
MLHSTSGRRASSVPRSVLRIGVLASVAGGVLGGGAAGALAADGSALGQAGAITGDALDKGLSGPMSHTVSGTGKSLHSSLVPATSLPLNPLAGTGSDLLDNSVGTQIADFREVSTRAVTGPLSEGDSLSELPGIGSAVNTVTGALPG